jgi:hypothetical protein
VTTEAQALLERYRKALSKSNANLFLVKALWQTPRGIEGTTTVFEKDATNAWKMLDDPPLLHAVMDAGY